MTLPPPPDARARYRQTAVRVFAVQLGALLVLWWLQAAFPR